MDDTISAAIFQHLVGLAALELDEEEATYLRRELNNQLRSIRELEAIQVEDSVPITSHGVPYSSGTRPPLRADEARPSTEADDDILAQAPEVENRYIVVPDIPSETLE